METLRKHRGLWREAVIAGLLLLNLAVWLPALARGETDKLRVYFLDIGQGDAILIDSPTHSRVLIDGGPDRKVLSELGRILPFGERHLDAVIETHPDADHITGLVGVLEDYSVGIFLEPGVESETAIYKKLESEVEERGVRKILARRGMILDLGGGAELVVLFPDRDVSGWETNDASIVAKLVYGGESFLLTGDSTKRAEYILMSLDKTVLDADVLKAGHHGSDTSTSLPYAEAVSPQYAVISAGKNNRYGHPKQSVLDILEQVGTKIVSTAELGSIEFETDGESLTLK